MLRLLFEVILLGLIVHYSFEARKWRARYETQKMIEERADEQATHRGGL